MKKELLEKFLNHQCSEEELQIIHHWLLSSGEEETTPFIKKVWEEAHPDAAEEQGNYNHILTNIFHRIQKDHRSGRKAIHLVSHPGFKIAAGLALIIMAGAVLFFVVQQYAVSTTQFTTGYGDTRMLELPDHSKVTLNANSTLTYHNNWEERDQREIWLEGEAYFEVAPVRHLVNDQVVQKKFIVHTQNLDVEVLGTRFNVNTRRDVTQVILASGKVKVDKLKQNKEAVYLEPGEMIEYSGSTSQLIKKQVDPKAYTSWKDNQLTFVAASLLEVSRALEDNFGYSTIFKREEIKSLKFTGSASTENIDAFLSDLSKIFNLHIEKKGNKIIIDKKQKSVSTK